MPYLTLTCQKHHEMLIKSTQITCLRHCFLNKSIQKWTHFCLTMCRLFPFFFFHVMWVNSTSFPDLQKLLFNSSDSKSSRERAQQSFLHTQPNVASSKNGKSRLLVAHACNPSYLRGWNWEGHSSRLDLANSSQDPISKITRAKWAGGMAQVVEHLLCKCEAQSSNHSTAKSINQRAIAQNNIPFNSGYFLCVCIWHCSLNSGLQAC
jgi:hypothetical protein